MRPIAMPWGVAALPADQPVDAQVLHTILQAQAEEPTTYALPLRRLRNVNWSGRRYADALEELKRGRKVSHWIWCALRVSISGRSDRETCLTVRWQVCLPGMETRASDRPGAV